MSLRSIALMTAMLMGGMYGPGMSHREFRRDRTFIPQKKFLLPVNEVPIHKGQKQIEKLLQKIQDGKYYSYSVILVFSTQKAFTKKMVKVQAEFDVAVTANKDEWLLENGVRIEELAPIEEKA